MSQVKEVVLQTQIVVLIITIVIINTAHLGSKNRSDTSNNWSDWKHFKIIQKIREHHTRKS
jgi:hypothetical protein